ncbi:hypothetical protein J6590_033443, partial [Homalodisca vitripennis]
EADEIRPHINLWSPLPAVIKNSDATKHMMQCTVLYGFWKKQFAHKCRGISYE